METLEGKYEDADGLILRWGNWQCTSVLGNEIARKWIRAAATCSLPVRSMTQMLDVTLVMIGQLSDSVREVLETRHINYESHAHVDDEALLMHFRSADILAFPSTYEGWGMPIIEAQATGRPVVTGNVASMPEAAGDAACLVDPFDVSSIRAGFVRVLNDKAYAHALIEAGRANARKYGEKEIANRYADLYRKISEASKAGRTRH